MTVNRRIFDRLSGVVRQTFPSATNVDIGRGTTSADVAGWDSLSYSILIMNVEAEFGIECPLEEVYGLEDLGQLADLIQRSLSDAGKS